MTDEATGTQVASLWSHKIAGKYVANNVGERCQICQLPSELRFQIEVEIVLNRPNTAIWDALPEHHPLKLHYQNRSSAFTSFDKHRKSHCDADVITRSEMVRQVWMAHGVDLQEGVCQIMNASVVRDTMIAIGGEKIVSGDLPLTTENVLAAMALAQRDRQSQERQEITDSMYASVEAAHMVAQVVGEKLAELGVSAETLREVVQALQSSPDTRGYFPAGVRDAEDHAEPLGAIPETC